MKVIFIADVQNVARAGQTREVADGYARNFLFPRKLAVLANSQAAAAVEVHLKKIVKQRALEEAEMAELAKKISGVQITLKAKVGEKDKLYGSITGADIAEALSKAAGFEIDKRKVELAEPIKQIGICDVTIRFIHDITATVQVTVMSDEEGAEKPVKAAKKTEKAEVPAEEKAKKPVKEKKAKAEKTVKEEKPPKAVKEEKTAKEEKPEKPAKEKKAKAEKAVKEEKPAKEEAPAKEEKKEKKEKLPKAEKAEKPAKEKKAKKTGEAVE